MADFGHYSRFCAKNGGFVEITGLTFTERVCIPDEMLKYTQFDQTAHNDLSENACKMMESFFK